MKKLLLLLICIFSINTYSQAPTQIKTRSSGLFIEQDNYLNITKRFGIPTAINDTLIADELIPYKLIYNKTLNKLRIYNGTTWIDTTPYKKYTVIISQSSTSEPTVEILENNIGNIIWTYGGIGYYYGDLSGAFVNNKTFFILQNSLGAGADIIKIGTISNNRIMLTVTNINGVNIDGVLIKASLEIRVYN